MKLELQIRSSTPADSSAVIEMCLRTYRARYPEFLGEEKVEAFIGSGNVESFVGETIEAAWVLTVFDEVAGCAVANGNRIEELVIDEQRHRRGLGSLLLAHVEKQLFSSHATLELDSFRDNAAANAFYARHGWQVVRGFTEEEYGVEMVRLRKVRPRG